MSKKSVHLLLGPETGQKSDYIEEIKKDLEKTHKEPPETHTRYGFDSEISEVLSLARNVSLFSAHSLILFHNVELVKKKEDTDLLKEYAQAPSNSATLILTSDLPRVDQKIEKALGKTGVKKVFWELFENKKQGWVVQRFKKAGLTITPEALDLFLETVENNTANFEIECEKFCLFFEKGTTIGIEDVEKLLYHSREESVFSLFSYMAQKNLTASLEVLYKIMLENANAGSGLLGGILWQWNQLSHFNHLVTKHYSTDEAFQTLNVRSKKMQKTLHTAYRNYPRKLIDRNIMLLAKYEELLRTMKRDIQEHLLQMFLYDFIRS